MEKHPFQHKAHEEQPPAAARARGFAAKNAPAGQRQIKTNIRRDELDIELPAPASATAPAKDGCERFAVSLPCGADLAWIYRASPPPSMLWPW